MANDYIKLLACPFCGGKADPMEIGRGWEEYIICCSKCQCGTAPFNTKEEAAAAWNTRVESGAQDD